MNIEINPDYEKSTTLRALSAFLTLLADEAEGETKDQKILSAIVQKGLNHVEAAPALAEVNAYREEETLALAEHEAAVEQLVPPAFQPNLETQIKVDAKRTRRTKAEIEAAKVAEQGNVRAASQNSSASEPQSSVGVSVQAADLTIDDVRAALQRYTAVQGMDDGIALLKSYGAGRISELGLEQYPLFIAECDAPAQEAA